jgi:hypothetical protein
MSYLGDKYPSLGLSGLSDVSPGRPKWVACFTRREGSAPVLSCFMAPSKSIDISIINFIVNGS